MVNVALVTYPYDDMGVMAVEMVIMSLVMMKLIL